MNMTDTIRAAVQTVRGNPGAVEALEREEAEQAEAAKQAAKRAADLTKKIESSIPGRADALIADYVAVSQDALRDAAERLARVQLQRELAAVPLNVAAAMPTPMRLGRAAVDAAMNRLQDAAPIPWDRQGRSGAALRSDQTRVAAEALEAAEATRPGHALSRAEAEQAAAERREELEATRRAAVERRKQEARASGALPKVKS